jgi:hypothetical protein
MISYDTFINVAEGKSYDTLVGINISSIKKYDTFINISSIKKYDTAILIQSISGSNYHEIDYFTLTFTRSEIVKLNFQ